MKSVFQTLVMSTVATVMFSCSNGDVDSVNLPDEALPKGELQINVKSDAQTAESNTDATIKNLHFLIFKYGSREVYQAKDLSQLAESTVFSSKPTTGAKDLAVVANWSGASVAENETKENFNNKRVELKDQSVGNFTMVGEQKFTVNKGLNETTVNLTRLVAKVVLRSVTVDENSEVDGKIQVKRAFMMNVNGESKLQGTGKGKDVEVKNPVMQGYEKIGENDPTYLDKLSKDYEANPLDFYVFENRSTTKKTMLVIEANYTKADGKTKIPVYYSVEVKTKHNDEDVAQPKVLRNNVYTINATIKRPGSLEPGDPSINEGDLEVSISVDEWIYNLEQGESFE